MKHHSAILTGALLLPSALMASRTGLNNVPDSDVSAPGTGVVQLYSSFGPGRDTSFLSGVRLGFEPCGQQIEIGWDARWQPGDESTAFFHGKWRIRLDERGDAFAVGFSNAAPRTRDRGITGMPQIYAVGTANLKPFRLHAGAAWQQDNCSLFAGLDHTFDVCGTKLKFRGDLTTVNDGRDLLGSAGFTWRVHPHLNLDLWESFPSAPGLHAYTTAKIGFHFNF